MRILIAGGSGMIGQELVRSFLANKDEVWVLSRDPQVENLPAGVRAEQWDGKTSRGWGRLAGEVDAIVNLAGANIGSKPWTNARKQVIRSSRVEAGQAIAEAVLASQRRPKVILQIAGIGFYGNQGDTLLNESAPPGNDFLASVGAEWERAISPVGAAGVRLAILRTGVVLTREGGVLAPFVLQNRLFAGGPLGSGKQWISWIHIQDLVSAFRFLLARDDAQGVFNVAAPQPLTNAEFGRTVSQVMHRPFWLPAPALALQIALGEMSKLVLEGQRISPQRLEEMGFAFQFDTLRKALDDLIGE